MLRRWKNKREAQHEELTQQVEVCAHAGKSGAPMCMRACFAAGCRFCKIRKVYVSYGFLQYPEAATGSRKGHRFVNQVSILSCKIWLPCTQPILYSSPVTSLPDIHPYILSPSAAANITGKCLLMQPVAASAENVRRTCSASHAEFSTLKLCCG